MINKLQPILSKREIEVVQKRLNNQHITQTESNYLSRSIRQKLKSAEFAASAQLLSLLDYRRKKYERSEKVLKNSILEAAQDITPNIKAIVLFGSYIRNCHTNYRDIDVNIILDKKIWKTSAEKHRLESNIEKAIDIKTDVNLIAYKELLETLPYSPLLQTELEDHKVIYGEMTLKKKIIDRKSVV